ncbi:MAG: RNA polymerase sigma factor RpoD/SigA [Pseudomonadota bacterium]
MEAVLDYSTSVSYLDSGLNTPEAWGDGLNYSASFSPTPKNKERDDNPYHDEAIKYYFNDIREHRLIDHEEELVLGRKILETREKMLELSCRVRTSFGPLLAFQKMLSDRSLKKKYSGETIEFVLTELDRVLDLIRELDSPGRELKTYLSQISGLKSRLSEAMGRMVVANLRLAVRIAKKYQHRGLALPDLIQMANLGLMKAAARYDYTTGNRFSTYACWWIRQAVCRALNDHGRTIRLPVHAIKKRSRFNQAFSGLQEENGQDPDLNELMERSGLSEDNVRFILQANLDTISLDHKIGDDGATLGDLLEDDSFVSPLEAAEEKERYHLTQTALEALPDRDREIIRKRFGLDGENPMTLEELGRILNISRERVRQLEQRAIERLREGAMGKTLETH